MIPRFRPSLGAGSSGRRGLGVLRGATIALALACASPVPDAIAYGVDSCAYCRMLIGDERLTFIEGTARRSISSNDSATP